LIGVVVHVFSADVAALALVDVVHVSLADVAALAPAGIIAGKSASVTMNIIVSGNNLELDRPITSSLARRDY
jgi:hypothetical protein